MKVAEIPKPRACQICAIEMAVYDCIIDRQWCYACEGCAPANVEQSQIYKRLEVRKK